MPQAPAAAPPYAVLPALLPWPQAQMQQTPQGPLWLRRQRYALSDSYGPDPFAAAQILGAQQLAKLLSQPTKQALQAQNLVFLDTETTGLMGGTGTVPFLVGLAYFSEDAFIVEQMVLCRLGEEAPILAYLQQRLQNASGIVTYNGKSFDWPLLRSRFVLARMAIPPIAAHIDLLHASRRLVRHTGGHRLVAMEQVLLQIHRQGDLPGHAIPEHYFAFLRGDAAARMADILKHNVDDILALAAVLVALCKRLAPAGHAPLRAAEQLAVSQMQHRLGAVDEAWEAAVCAVHTAADADALPAALWYAQLCCRKKLYDKAYLALQRALLRSSGVLSAKTLARAHLALAKLTEHRLGNCARALVHAGRTQAAEGPVAQARRIARLHTKLRAQGILVRSAERAFVEQDDGHRLAATGAPLQKLPLLTAHAQERVLHAFARDENIVRKYSDPGAGVAVPGPGTVR